jgi:hypothetical protein
MHKGQGSYPLLTLSKKSQPSLIHGLFGLKSKQTTDELKVVLYPVMDLLE